VLPGDQIEGFLFRPDPFNFAAGQVDQLDIIPQPAGMIDQMLHRDGRIIFGQFGRPSLNRIIQRQMPGSGGMQHDGGGKLLAHRPQIKIGLGGDGRAPVQIGHAIALGVLQGLFGIHPDSAAWRGIGLIVLKHRVNGGRVYRDGLGLSVGLELKGRGANHSHEIHML